MNQCSGLQVSIGIHFLKSLTSRQKHFSLVGFAAVCYRKILGTITRRLPDLHVPKIPASPNFLLALQIAFADGKCKLHIYSIAFEFDIDVKLFYSPKPRDDYLTR
jgi:hypothetical protein